MVLIKADKSGGVYYAEVSRHLNFLSVSVCATSPARAAFAISLKHLVLPGRSCNAS